MMPCKMLAWLLVLVGLGILGITIYFEAILGFVGGTIFAIIMLFANSLFMECTDERV